MNTATPPGEIGIRSDCNLDGCNFLTHLKTGAQKNTPIGSPV